MGAAHAHVLHVHGHSPLHRAPAHLKVLALLGFMLVVVATPAPWWPAFVAYALVLAVAATVARLPPRFLATRLVVETPFVVFALLLPFVAVGPRVEVLGLALSQAGLAGAAELLVKGTLGVLASLVLAATTEPRRLVEGLERLHVPGALVLILSLMLRYLEVVTDELRRMRIGLTARGFDGRSVRHWPVIARSAGALFIRSFERGERVHLAMLARGFEPGRRPPSAGEAR